MLLLRALTAALVALFMLGVGVQDRLRLCRSAPAAHHSCCCKHRVGLAPLGEELSSAPCCDPEAALSAAVPPSSGAMASFFLEEPVRLEGGLPTASLLALAGDAPAPRAAPLPLTTGPPLHIRHHALLI